VHLPQYQFNYRRKEDMNNIFLEKRVHKFTYEPLVDGATKNTVITLAGKLPAGALITGGYLVTNTDFTGATTTISIGYTGAATAFLPATTATTMDVGEVSGLLVGAPAVGSNASTLDAGTAVIFAARVAASQIYLDAEKSVIVTLSNDNDLTAGKFTMFLEYVVM
jgi:hypothetical protein